MQPYRSGRFLHDIYPEAPKFGVQYNVCVDEFTPENGATQFIKGSHHTGTDPPLEMQIEEVTAGEESLFEDVYQVTAPAGAAFIYDARLWHRACPELNHTESWRVAILNYVLPTWVTPMLPREEGAEMFMSSLSREVLSPREVRDVEAMCCMQVLQTMNFALNMMNFAFKHDGSCIYNDTAALRVQAYKRKSKQGSFQEKLQSDKVITKPAADQGQSYHEAGSGPDRCVVVIET